VKRLIIIIGSAICLSGCFSIMNIHGAIQSHSKYERLDVKEAAITQDGVLIMNGSHFLDGFSKEKDYTVLIDLKSFVVESKLVPVSGVEPTDFIILPRSMISSRKTVINDKMLNVKVIKIEDCRDIVNRELGDSKRKVNYRESKFALCTDQSWDYDVHYNGWLLASDSYFLKNERRIRFGIEAKKTWPRLGYLLLTPITLFVDVVTLPGQIIYSFKDNPFR